MIGWQLQDGGRLGQLPLPVAELLIEYVSFEPLPLPDGVVGVLNRQGRQHGLLPARIAGVESGLLLHEDGERPAIGDDVMQAQ